MKRKYCPECDPALDRREFLVQAGRVAAVAGSAALWANLPRVHAAPQPTSAAETCVKQFYDSLSAAQKSEICFPFEHELRHRISANWSITKHTIGSSFYTAEQRELIRQIIRHVTSPDGYERLMRQMDDDWGGWEAYTVAIFGEPGQGKFQWEMTGRHLTLRADGDSVDRAAFGGPIIYGHGEESKPEANLFYYQTKQVNEIFAALDSKQREQALIERAPRENEVPIQGSGGTFPGLPASELSADQKELLERVIRTILAPYRQEDVDEVMAILKATGGLEKLHLAFYKQGDLQNDGIWDIWRLEGPGFVWHFRGAPHVHAYVNIGIVS
ncbi:MAG: hypothetical protein KatS3mg109_0812 [Pirellulaceae bacterium]|nr:MAG: hypothetical protein KatS3mg109_0812 [Pirellulaceae bacterium]